MSYGEQTDHTGYISSRVFTTKDKAMKAKAAEHSRQEQLEQLETGGGYPTGTEKTIHTSINNGSSLETNKDMSGRRMDTLWIIVVLVIGLAAAMAFCITGLNGARNDQQLRFEKQASDCTHSLENQWNKYVTAALWVHEACRGSGDHAKSPSNTTFCSRQDFYELFEYVKAGGLDFQVVIFSPFVTHDQRAGLELEAREFYAAHYPHVNYSGFTQFATEQPTYDFVFERRTNLDYYIPNHYVEPVQGNEYRIDFDLNSHASFTEGLWTWQILTVGPYQPSSFNSDTDMVIIHPGTPVSDEERNGRSTGLSMFNVHFAGLVENPLLNGENKGVTVSVFVQDMFGEGYTHFGAASLEESSYGLPPDSTTEANQKIQYGEREDIETARSRRTSGLYHEEAFVQEGRTFVVIVTSNDDLFAKDTTDIIVGTVLIAVACLAVAVCLWQRMRRIKKVNAVKAAAESERTALIIHNAQQATKKEREMNEYLSHEVRNPLTASLCAAHNLSLVAKGMQHDRCSNPGDVQTMVDDIEVIQSSLTHVNDLLRSMLDMHKVASDQLKIDLVSTEILKDVFEPVKTIVYRSNDDYELIMDCPPDLVVLADRLRLKQIVLNLVGNSKKFVQKGFICMKAAVVESKVEISVHDSGPGIPGEKRARLFSRFQESLDSLSQGTGMGLALSKNLAEMMGGDLSLDNTYHSGVSGSPGARFILILNVAPLELDRITFDTESGCTASHDTNDNSSERMLEGESMKLPEALSVLITDDDLLIRKMLSRSLKRIAPTWRLQEACNGETAIRLAGQEHFDLIFLDMYMASVERQLLGTETAQTLRANGCQSCICGLSANAMEDAFLKAGADAFVLKPFPCAADALRTEIFRVLNSSNKLRENL